MKFWWGYIYFYTWTTKSMIWCYNYFTKSQIRTFLINRIADLCRGVSVTQRGSSSSSAQKRTWHLKNTIKLFYYLFIYKKYLLLPPEWDTNTWDRNIASKRTKFCLAKWKFENFSTPLSSIYYLRRIQRFILFEILKHLGYI